MISHFMIFGWFSSMLTYSDSSQNWGRPLSSQLRFVFVALPSLEANHLGWISTAVQGGAGGGCHGALRFLFRWLSFGSFGLVKSRHFFFQKRGKVKPASRTMAFDWKKIFWRKVDVNFFHLPFEKPGFSSMFCGSQRRWWRNPSRTLASQAEFLGYV